MTSTMAEQQSSHSETAPSGKEAPPCAWPIPPPNPTPTVKFNKVTNSTGQNQGAIKKYDGFMECNSDVTITCV